MTIDAVGYKQTSLSFILNENEYINQKAYLFSPSTTTANISITVYRVGNVALDSVLVTAETFVNNTWQPFSSGLTDNAGKVILQVDSSTSVRFIFAKDGFTTATQINTPQLIQAYAVSGLSIVLINSNEPSMINSATYVDWSYTPTNSTLIANDTQNFLMTTSIQTGTLEYSRVRFYYNGTVLATYQLNSSTGGQFGLTINTTPYINKTITLLYEYKKPNFALVQNIRGYFVIADNQSQAGSIQKSQDWILTINFETRLLYYIASIIIFMICLITFIRNMFIVAIGTVIWAGSWGFYFIPETAIYITTFISIMAIIILVGRARQ